MQQSTLSTLDELRCLVALADAGSFVAAGQLLGLDASMVSRRLQALERNLGVRLVERTTRRIEITEAGRTYLVRVRPLLNDLTEAEQELADLATGEPTGHLRISLPGNFGAAWLGPAIASFLAAHPRITIDADTTNRYVNIVEERYDLAIRLGSLGDSTLVARRIAERRRLLCASPSYIAARGTPRSPIDLAGHRCLCSTGRKHADRWSFMNADGSETEVVVEARYRSSDAELLLHAARAGLGILYTSDWYVGSDLAAGALVEILPDHPLADRGGVFIVTPAARGMPSKTRAFSDWLMAELKAAPWRPPSSPSVHVTEGRKGSNV